MRLDFRRDLVTRSGRVVVVAVIWPRGPRCLGLRSRRRERARGGGARVGFPRDGRPQITIKLGRPTAGCRIAERRVLSTAGSWARTSQRQKTRAKAINNMLSRIVRGARQ